MGVEQIDAFARQGRMQAPRKIRCAAVQRDEAHPAGIERGGGWRSYVVGDDQRIDAEARKSRAEIDDAAFLAADLQRRQQLGDAEWPAGQRAAIAAARAV
jgi:hypothetical protein